MKRIIEEYAWVGMILAFLGGIVFLYTYVDRVSAAGNDMDVPAAVEASAILWGNYYGIAPEFLEAAACKESGYNPNAVNGSCIGLMQINRNFHQERMQKVGATNLLDIDQNMRVAADYFAELFEEYEDPNVVLTVYNGQSDYKIARAIQGDYMSEYAESILDLAQRLERMHELKRQR